MVWAAFCADRRSDLVVMPGDSEAKNGGVTSRIYLEILKENLETVLDYDSVFMQDNVPIHTAKKIMSWFEDNDINIMKWPSYSLDLNPIEHL